MARSANVPGARRQEHAPCRLGWAALIGRDGAAGPAGRGQACGEGRPGRPGVLEIHLVAALRKAA